MSAIFILIGFSMLIAGGFLVAYVWSVKDGQYEDDETPAIRVLFDDENQTPSTKESISNIKTSTHAN